MERSTIVIVHEGVHARPATRFLWLAKSFQSDFEIVKEGKAVRAHSSLKLMLLSVKENQEVTVRANGADSADADEALIRYLENPRLRSQLRGRGLDRSGGRGGGACQELRSRQCRLMLAPDACMGSRLAKESPSDQPSRIFPKRSSNTLAPWPLKTSHARSSASPRPFQPYVLPWRRRLPMPRWPIAIAPSSPR